MNEALLVLAFTAGLGTGALIAYAVVCRAIQVADMRPTERQAFGNWAAQEHHLHRRARGLYCRCAICEWDQRHGARNP